jgi:predicted lipoprotein with Yx(FWY)xxD motif
MNHCRHFSASFGVLASLLIGAGCADRMATPETPMQPAAGRAPERMFSEQQPVPETEPAAPSVGVASIGIARTSAGQPYLVDAAGRSIYLFLADEGGTGSKCYDACATAWPPVITSGAPKTLTVDLDTTKLGTIARKDGTLQVTYAGWPLYYTRDRRENPGQDLMDPGLVVPREPRGQRSKPQMRCHHRDRRERSAQPSDEAAEPARRSADDLTKHGLKLR